MKQHIDLNDGDLQYIVACIDKLTGWVDFQIKRIISLRADIKITVLGYTLMTVEAKLNEHQTVPKK